MKEVKSWVLFKRNLLLPFLGMNDSRTLDIVKLTQSEIVNVRELLEWMLLENCQDRVFK